MKYVRCVNTHHWEKDRMHAAGTTGDSNGIHNFFKRLQNSQTIKGKVDKFIYN